MDSMFNARATFGGVMTVEFIDGRTYTILDARDFVVQLWNGSYTIVKSEEEYMVTFARRAWKAFQIQLDVSSCDAFLADLIRNEIVFLHGGDA